MPPQVLEQVSVLVKRFGAAHGGDPGAVGAVLPRWARAACLTTIRAGLLLAGDLEVAVRLGEALAAPVGIDPADVVRDLAAWSTSEGYSELRTALGLRTITLPAVSARRQRRGCQPVASEGAPRRSEDATVEEREGFEPSVPFGTHDFQSCPFGHSGISPGLCSRRGWESNPRWTCAQT